MSNGRFNDESTIMIDAEDQLSNACTGGWVVDARTVPRRFVV